jgi:hypothetical protein
LKPSAIGAEEASEELRIMQGKIRDLKLDHARNLEAKQESLQEIRGEARVLRRTLESLKKQVDTLNAQIGGKEKQRTEKGEALAEKKKTAEKLKQQMTRYLDTVREHVEAGIPWKKDVRLNSIRQATAIVEDTSTGLFPSLAAVGRVQQEEEALARHVELSTIEVPYGGKKLAVQGFHFGLLAVIYANEEGSVLGFVQAGEEIKDGIRTVENSPFAEEGYLSAVDILRRRRTPGIVDLYLPTLPVTEGGE